MGEWTENQRNWQVVDVDGRAYERDDRIRLDGEVYVYFGVRNAPSDFSEGEISIADEIGWPYRDGSLRAGGGKSVAPSVFGLTLQSRRQGER